MSDGKTVSVVIPSYNMSWCIGRAIASVAAQSYSVHEIIVVDDCSTDDTASVVQAIAMTEPRVIYLKPDRNGGHLAALRFGAAQAAGDWIAFLDADDEFTPRSIEARVTAARRYQDETGVQPQLVYGDHVGSTFPSLRGYAFPYLSRELCLCQTSTMMLGRDGAAALPVTGNWNTDDEIVLALGKRFHILHAGAEVAVYYVHAGATRMGNNAKRVCQGVEELVRDHRTDILEQHGRGALALWWLRILRARLRYRISLVSAALDRRTEDSGRLGRLALKAYRRILTEMRGLLTAYLSRHFERCNF